MNCEGEVMKFNYKSVPRLLFLMVGFILVVYPLFFIFISSFKKTEELYSFTWSLPKNWDYSPYIRLFTEYGFGTAFKNSLLYSAICCIITIILITTAAYGIARMKWKLSKLALGFIMTGIMIPVHAIVIPLYITASQVNLPRVYILMLIYIATSIPTSLFIMVGFMESVPRTLEEAAVLDGCSIIRAFISIICPILKPPLATITILNFNGIWNDYMMALIFVDSDKYKTVQLAVTNFNSGTSTNYPMLLSAIVVALVPSVVVCVFMTDKLTSGITAGSIKA